MTQQEFTPRFSHKLSQLQQARLRGEITVDEYKKQLTDVIEEEVCSDEQVNQERKRAYLWTQTDAAWKHLEAEKVAQEKHEREKIEKDQQASEKKEAMEAQKVEANKLSPFTGNGRESPAHSWRG